MWNQASKLACIDGPSHTVFVPWSIVTQPYKQLVQYVWCPWYMKHQASLYINSKVGPFWMEWPSKKKKEKKSGGTMFSWNISKISLLAWFIYMCTSHELFYSLPLGWWISPLRCMSEQPLWNHGSSTLSKGRCQPSIEGGESVTYTITLYSCSWNVGTLHAEWLLPPRGILVKWNSLVRFENVYGMCIVPETVIIYVPHYVSNHTGTTLWELCRCFSL